MEAVLIQSVSSVSSERRRFMLIQRYHRGELHVKKEYRFGVLDVGEEHGGRGDIKSGRDNSQNIGLKAVKYIRL